MKTLYAIIATALLFGCSTPKKVVKETHSTDSATHTRADSLQQDSISVTTTTTRDTAIITPYSAAVQVIPLNDLHPARKFTQRTGHATTTVLVDSAGTITATCECDSVKTLVRSLTERNTYLEKRIKQHTASTEKSTKESYSASIEKGLGWVRARSMRIWMVICLFLAAEFLYRAYRKKF